MWEKSTIWSLALHDDKQLTWFLLQVEHNDCMFWYLTTLLLWAHILTLLKIHILETKWRAEIIMWFRQKYNFYQTYNRQLERKLVSEMFAWLIDLESISILDFARVVLQKEQNYFMLLYYFIMLLYYFMLNRTWLFSVPTPLLVYLCGLVSQFWKRIVIFATYFTEDLMKVELPY